MARTSNEDPLKEFNFVVEIDGFARAGFMECSGLEIETEISEYREGGDSETPQKSAGQSKFTDIVLKRGQIIDSGENDFYNWAQQTFSKDAPPIRDYRREPEIVQRERGGSPAMRWRVYEAFVNKFKPVGTLNAMTHGPAIEELTLAHEGFSKV